MGDGAVKNMVPLGPTEDVTLLSCHIIIIQPIKQKMTGPIWVMSNIPGPDNMSNPSCQKHMSGPMEPLWVMELSKTYQIHCSPVLWVMELSNIPGPVK